MADLTIKPQAGSGNKLIIQDQAGNARITTGNAGIDIPAVTGNLTVAGDIVPSTPLSHRNVWINGAMQISQRYGTTVHTPTHPNYGLDRYKIHYSGGPVYSSQQVTDVPAGKGFKYSAKYTVTTADATATSTDQAYVKTMIEGYDWARFCYGTASAKTTTLSFYVKSSVAGVYSMAYKNASVNRSYSQVYTISSANTWERISITIPGDTSGTWATDNTIGCSISFDLGSGTGRYQTAGSWGTGNIDGATSAGADTWINTGGATFYITGIQLEEGSNATPFEHRSYGDELARCMRYYWRWAAGSYPYSAFAPGQGYSGSQANAVRSFPVTMRTAPSFAVSSDSHFWWSSGAGNTGPSDIEQWGANVDTSLLIINCSATAGYGGYLRAGNSTAAYAEYNAEL